MPIHVRHAHALLIRAPSCFCNSCLVNHASRNHASTIHASILHAYAYAHTHDSFISSIVILLVSMPRQLMLFCYA